MNWNHLKGAVLTVLVWALFYVPLVIQAQSPNGIRGSFAGDVYVNPAFKLYFGSGASTDAKLSQQHSNTLTLEGHLGGGAANDDKFGVCTLGTNCNITFTTAYVSNPVCVGTDTSAIDAVKAAVSTTGVTFTGNSTDVIDYACFGNPN